MIFSFIHISKHGLSGVRASIDFVYIRNSAKFQDIVRFRFFFRIFKGLLYQQYTKALTSLSVSFSGAINGRLRLRVT